MTAPRSRKFASPVVRKLALISAALAVMILPTACDGAAYAGTKPPPAAGNGGNNGGGGNNGNGGSNGGGGGGGHGGGHGGGGATATPSGTATPSTSDAPTTSSAQPTTAAPTTAPPTTTTAPTTTAPTTTAPPTGLDVLGTDCSTSGLAQHTGFQVAPACVPIAFGEVAAAADSPSLLITSAPETVAAGAPFTLTVSSRNLVRDRFLAAAQGGYYRESSFLNSDGIQRGHIHTACRMLGDTAVAPDSAPPPAAFVVVQDNGGGRSPDTVTIEVPGLPAAGTGQCAVWAGDGSHRVPMMQRANQTPAFDMVRVTVS